MTREDTGFTAATRARNGQSLVEVLIAMAVGVLMIMAAITLIAPALKSHTEISRQQVAIALGRELLDNVRVFSEANWHNISGLATSSASHYYLNASSSPFSIASGDESVTVATTTYTRYFYLDDVKRDGTGNITTTGGKTDPSTRQVTVVYAWPRGTELSLSTYVTRTRNLIFSQTDWSGGSGQEGPATSVGNRFAASFNVDFTTTTGSISLAEINNEAVDYPIDAADRYAWSEHLGWIDFGTGTVTVSSSQIKGYANATTGDIALDCATSPNGNVCGVSDFKVANEGDGTLSGWAWGGENLGWVSFSCTDTSSCGTVNYGVSIDAQGYFSGWAWTENAGWISFSCTDTSSCGTSDYRVKTSWKP